MLSYGVALVGGLADPPHRLGVVLRYTLALGVPQPEVELGDGVSLVGGLPIPLHRLGVVLRDALALGVHGPEVVLSVGEALVGTRTQQPKRGRVVPAVIGGLAILQRSCCCRSGKAKG